MPNPSDSAVTDLKRTPLSPFGVLLESPTGDADFRDIAPETLGQWTDEAKVVVLRGFKLLEKEDWVAYCETWGEILQWDFGAVLDLNIQEDPKNYLFARGSVPFHWDGAFAKATPHYFMFQCHEAPEAGGGETVFCDTRLVYQDASAELRQRWDDISITYRTDKLAHYGGKVTRPLVDVHPQSGEKVLRYAEPLPADKFLNPLSVEPEGIPEAEHEAFIEEIRDITHRPEYCYAHGWRSGDILIAENHSLIHGRNAFVGDSSRWLQRIQIL
ncbi:TauD/TfdA family dioxygenase [Streptomyces sp. LX-29]|uniref:TauD/TfdA dioxygenase family protein n=1 Tax=Streptomyces sp. LX-29 TaxID=2900152 RepID=UPI00240E5D95|nr:TauD/TfdA family dioxygenase [Streptomyces sp. LX-29]WFB10935.1 TauD/TfdA family dioxygenase [Streptomyces sp. LX-29]